MLEEFLKCPSCGGQRIERTLMLMPPERGPDMNKAGCAECGWRGYLEACKVAARDRQKVLDEVLQDLECDTITPEKRPGMERAIERVKLLKEKL